MDIMKRNELYYSTPIVKNSKSYPGHVKKSEMVSLFMGDCSSSNCTCIQSRLLGPSDTYSATSSQRSYPVNLMSGSSSLTSSSYTQWVLPPYTPMDTKPYANVPLAYKPRNLEVKIQRGTSRRSVWLGLIFGFFIFLLIVLGAVFAYGLKNGML